MADRYHTLIIPLQSKLYRFAWSFLKDDARASDAVQDVLTKLWQRREKLEELENPEAWTMRMVRNRCIDELRYNGRFAEAENMVVNRSDDSRNAVQAMENQDTEAWLEKLLEDLPAKQREIFHLREVEEYSYQEIADILEIDLSVVKVNLHRARKELRKKMIKIHAYGT